MLVLVFSGRPRAGCSGTEMVSSVHVVVLVKTRRNASSNLCHHQPPDGGSCFKWTVCGTPSGTVALLLLKM